MATAKFRFDRAGSILIPITVDFSVSGTATFGTDYIVSDANTFTATSGSVIIPAGSTFAEVSVSTIVDTVIETDETIILRVLANSLYAIQTTAPITVTILNDDFALPGVLDQITAVPGAAYSLRLLRSAYTGPAIRVKRSSDSTETDIQFIGNQLDTSSLLSFAGTGSATVIIWYDQSGNSRNAIAASPAAVGAPSAQPTIVINGVLTTGNSALTIAQNIHQYFIVPTAYLPQGQSQWTVNYVGGMQATGVAARILSAQYPANNWLFGFYNGGQQQAYFQGGNLTSTPSVQRVLQSYTAIGNGASVAGSCYKNGVNFSTSANVSSLSPATNNAALNTNGSQAGEGSNSYFSELIIFNGSLSTAHRTIIEADQITYYSI